MNETRASGVLATWASVTILPFSSRRQTAVLASDLALLVDAEYERALGRVEIEAYDVP